MIVATALNFLLTPLSTLLPYFVKFDHLGDARDLAFVMVFFQGGILAGGLLMSIISGFKKRMLVVTVSIYVVFFGYVLVALTPKGLFWFMALAAVVLAFCLPIANVLIQTIMQVVVPLEMQGRVNSVSSGLASAATPVGMILSGAIVAFTETSNLFLACAVAGFLVLTVSWFFTDFRHVEKMEEVVNNQKGGERSG
jgi:DHA3 family macrolide efflux protein-like MFS transporter